MIENSEFDKILNPRVVSKDTDKSGRADVYQQVKDERAKHKEIDETIALEEEARQKLAEIVSETYRTEGEKQRELEERTKKLIVRIKEKFGLSDKQIIAFSNEIDAISEMRVDLYRQIYAIEDKLNQLTREKRVIPNPKDLINAYYEKVANRPLTNEQKRELLLQEALAQLSMDEYIKLWKKLNPHFLSHVTRQGFRDHNAMMYHSAGLNEFHNGFIGVAEDGNMLRPPIAVHELKDRTEASVKSWMGDWVFEGDEKEAYDRLDRLLNATLASAPHYPDKTAVHFAAQIVADDYYGGERNNEVFFIFPSDFIASQHDFAFNGWEKDFTKPQSEAKWNDVFVWPKSLDDAGISVDAGIVFLPKNILVDASTGSKYASERIIDDRGEPKLQMSEDVEKMEKFIQWGQNQGEGSITRNLFLVYKEERNYWTRQDKEDDLKHHISNELQALGFGQEQAFVLAHKMFSYMHSTVEFTPEFLDHIIRESGAHYKRTENGIPAEKYWEEYFSKNEKIRPKHIVYYDGDPTSAVAEFQRKNGIGMADTSKEEGDLLGFDDRHVVDMRDDVRANKGKQELEDMAKKIIAEHYDQTKE